MNARGVALSLIVVFLLGTFWGQESSVHGETGVHGDTGDDARIDSLQRRIARLEAAVAQQDPARQLSVLRSRIDDLEREARKFRNGEVGVSATTQLNDVAQLRRESSEFSRLARSLESKVNASGQQLGSMRRELSRLQSKVSSLQTTVDRLR